MDTTVLLAALPTSIEENICLLFEAGAQPETEFLAFKAKHENRLHSLYIHPQLAEFQDYGPWLLEIDNTAQLQGYLDTLPGCVAVIASTRYPPSLAVQLSRGCTIVPPDGSTALVRFYASHVIEVLAGCARADWQAFLFNDITQWWLPGEAQWLSLSIASSETQHPSEHIIRLDKITWQQIADKPEVTSVLNEWQKMPTSQGFPPCAQRLMVVKALNKSEGVGLEKPADRMLYALCYLNGGKEMLESEPVCKSLPTVVAGKQQLAEVLSRQATALYTN